MKNFKLKSWITMLMAAIVIAGGFTSCDDDNDPVAAPSSVLGISGVVIPPVIETYRGAIVTLTGKGFEVGDILTFKTSNGTTFTSTITSVTANSATFTVPMDIETALYAFSVSRDGVTVSLNYLNVRLVIQVDIPDVAGKNVKGVVHCNGLGISGVVVSDGVEVTTTDADGVYYLASLKKHGYVFISVPSGYEAYTENNIPQFFAYLTEPQTVTEQKNFGLTAVDNTNHTIVAMADMHLANRNNDLTQFENGFLTEVKAMSVQYNTLGKKIYGLPLGDQTWEVYWYDNNYALPNYLQTVKDIGMPLYNVIGNHDNDYFYAGDFAAEQTYKSIIGPTYYSFNIGEIHYIVLDNVEYINANGAIGINSSIPNRDYNNKITDEQIAWLKKDLATITDKSTPIIVAMHCNYHWISFTTVPTFGYSTTNHLAFRQCFDDFTEPVHILTGHTHRNYNIVNTLDGRNLFEHNTGAVCATWWWTGRNNYAGNHIGTDGAPGGYGVYEINGRDIKWYYKGIGSPKEKQFRTYDRNKIEITADKYCPAASAANKTAFNTTYAGEYFTPSTDNYVLINVWNFDPAWTIEVTEGGTPLTITRTYVKDPLHIISYEAQRYRVADATPNSSFVTDQSTNIFRVQASSPTSTLSIKVTDRFGNVYTEEMTRPKDFHELMQ